MSAERFRLACEAFEAARTAPREEREAVLVRACGGDAELEAEVRDLLRHHDIGADALDEGVGGDVVGGDGRPVAGDVLDGYRLVERLGEGGMGIVFLAEAPDGTRVAVKILHAHLGSSGRHRERFLREARIGAGVDHPAVVRVLDAGVASRDGRDVPFLVMEHVEGQSLRALLDEIGRASEDLCRHVGRELADALAAVHAVGVVHRDVKPDNVMITPDHAVKLMDLGVAHVSDASAVLSRTGAFIGSLHYASPEQFQGDGMTLDGRADLHALGILLYEMASGDNPFAGGDLAVVMRRVLDVVPTRLGDLNSQVSALFEEIVHALLEKDRGARLQSAAELRDVLDGGDESDWWGQRQAELRARSRRRLRRPHRPRDTALHGRDAELAQLESAFAAAVDGRGAVVLVDGEPGIGKTRLVDEIVDCLERGSEPPDLLFGGYSPVAASGSTGAVLAALREHFGSGAVRARLSELLADAPDLARGLSRLIVGDTDADEASLRPLARDAAEAAIVRVIQALAAERPVVLVVDDLHFAPAEGRAVFLALAQAVRGHRVLVIGTARQGLPERFVSAISALPHARRITLARLGARDLGQLLADALGSERLADELGWQLARKTDGNPFFVFEILRGLRESGRLRRAENGTWSTTGVIGEIDVPSSVTDLIEARIAVLSEEEQEILDVASCCGFEFAPALVAAALGSARIPVLRSLGRIERHHRLVRASGPQFVFDHHQVQEALYSRLSPALRAEYHAVLGDAQEQAALVSATREKVRGATAAQLAGHFLRGGSADRARAYLPAALDHLEARSQDDAAALCTLALEAPGTLVGEERLAALRRLIAYLEHLGRREEHDALTVEALALAEELGDREARLDVEGRRGWLLLTSGRAGEAEELLGTALVEARERGLTRLECTLLAHYGAAAAEQARFDVSRERLTASLELARQLEDPQLEANALGGLGSTAWSLGDFDTARRCDERALELAVELGDRRREAVAVGNLGTMHSAAGEYARSLELQRRRLRISREIGYRRGEAIATGNLGLAMAILGRPDESLALHERQVAVCREIGHRRGEASGLLSLASAHVALRNFDAAEPVCREGVDVAREIGAQSILASAEQMLGDILHAQGRVDEARERFEVAHTVAESSGVAIERVISLLLAARLPGGDVDAARVVYEAHRDRLPLRVRMHAEHLMYGLTGERGHLDAAWERLTHLRDNAPPEYHRSMMRDQPMHRAIEDDVLAASASSRDSGGSVAGAAGTEPAQ